MKKVFALFLTMVLVMSLVGCGREKGQDFFTAEVMEVHEEYLLLEVFDTGSSNFSAGAKVEVSTKVVSADGCPAFMAGEYARVLLARHTGDNPPGRLEALAIYKTDETGTVTAETGNADEKSVAEDLTGSNAVYLCQFVKDRLGEPDSFPIHSLSHMEEKGRHFYYLDFSHRIKNNEVERTYYFAEFDGSTLLCIVNERSAIHYQTEGDYTTKYPVISAMFQEHSSGQLDVAWIVSHLS